MAYRVYEHLNRSIVKAITFRLFILVSDTIVIFAVTRRYDVTLSVILVSNFASTILYIIHERLWNTIHWGRNHHKK